MKFQSTRPVRGATSAKRLVPDYISISIHAPRAGRDHAASPISGRARHFNPRAPCGARLLHSIPRFGDFCISIHAPRAGRDDPAHQ